MLVSTTNSRLTELSSQGQVGYCPVLEGHQVTAMEEDMNDVMTIEDDLEIDNISDSDSLIDEEDEETQNVYKETVGLQNLRRLKDIHLKERVR